jgi:hypothetical protein
MPVDRSAFGGRTNIPVTELAGGQSTVAQKGADIMELPGDKKVCTCRSAESVSRRVAPDYGSDPLLVRRTLAWQHDCQPTRDPWQSTSRLAWLA